MGQLLYLPFSAAEGTFAINTYLSATGNDANDGLSSGAPVLTWDRMWAVAGGAEVIVVHIVGTIADEYVPPPITAKWVVLTGDDAFTEVATGAAGAATTDVLLELAVASGADDDLRHFTLEFTDGAAAGYRRTIRSNTTTLVTPVQPFENLAAAVVPVPGDTYRILRPSARIQPGGATAGASSLSNGAGTRIDIINIAIAPTNAGALNYLTCADGIQQWFGVLIEGTWYLDTNGGSLFAGVDDGFNVGVVKALRDLLGSTDILGQWHGWGLGFELATFSGTTPGLQMQQKIGGIFRGFLTAGACRFNECSIYGGSFWNAIFIAADAFVWSTNLGNTGARPNIPILLKTANLSGSGMNVQATAILFGARVGNNANFMEVEYSGTIGATTGVIFVQGIFNPASSFKLTYTGGVSDGAAVRTTRGGGTFLAVSGFTLDCANCTAFILDQTSNMALSSGTVTARRGVQNNGGLLALGYASFSTNVFTCTEWVLRQTAGETTFNGGSFTSTGSDAELVKVTGGSLEQLAGTVSCINNTAGAGDALVVQAGATAHLLGSTSSVFTASAAASGYGVNARFGGKVYFDAEPDAASVVGVTADLTVGSGGGEDQPTTVLNASESGLARAGNLSVIARAN